LGIQGNNRALEGMVIMVSKEKRYLRKRYLRKKKGNGVDNRL
jgi:hypothetical protein